MYIACINWAWTKPLINRLCYSTASYIQSADPACNLDVNDLDYWQPKGQ